MLQRHSIFNPPSEADVRNAKLLDERHGLSQNNAPLAAVKKQMTLPGRMGELSRARYVQRVTELLQHLLEHGCFEPTSDISNGRWHLGNAGETPLCLTDEEMLRGVILNGPPGSGKTSSMTYLLQQCETYNIPVTIIDLKDDYRWFAARNTNTIIFHPACRFGLFDRDPRIPKHEFVTTFIRTFNASFYAAEGVAQIGEEAYKKAVQRHGTPSPYDVLLAARSLHEKGESFQRKDRIDAFIHRLERFNNRWEGMAMCRTGIPHTLFATTNKLVHGQPNESTEFLAAFIIHLTYQLSVADGNRNVLKQVIFIDEGLLTFGEANRIDGPPLLRLLPLLREWGIATVVSTVHLAGLPELARAAAFSTVQLPVGNATDMIAITKTIGMTREQADLLLRMHVGEAYVRTGKCAHLLRVTIPHYRVDKRIDQATWKECLERSDRLATNYTCTPPEEAENPQLAPAKQKQPVVAPARLAAPAVPAADEPPAVQPAPVGIVLTEPEVAFARYLHKSRIATGKEARDALSMSASTGQSIITKLTQLGFITAHDIRTGAGQGRSGKGLQLTPDALTYLQLKPIKAWRGATQPQGIYILSRLQELTGASVEVHLPMTGSEASESVSGQKAPDLLLRVASDNLSHRALMEAITYLGIMLGTENTITDKALIAIEYETDARATLLNNYRKNRAAGIKDHIYALLTDEEVTLAKQLLLMSGEPLTGFVAVVNALRLLDALREPTKNTK